MRRCGVFIDEKPKKIKIIEFPQTRNRTIKRVNDSLDRKFGKGFRENESFRVKGPKKSRG